MEFTTLEKAKKLQVKVDELRRRIELLEKLDWASKMSINFYDDIRQGYTSSYSSRNHFMEMFSIDEDTRICLNNHYRDLIECYLEDIKKL